MKKETEQNTKIRQIEKDLFNMVYAWGKSSVITDELCNAFQYKLEEYRNLLAPNQLRDKR
jgi:hypothetical protein